MPTPTALPADYAERVYAGVLGKIIGVYLGRPFEGWSHDRIMERLGEIDYYVHDKLGMRLIVTDDDIAGTLTFVRSLPDNGNNPQISAADIGRSWLNYLIPQRTVLWWGGLGNSTEHTAYLRLASGIDAPRSGSMALNGQVVAEQIGAQIFIDGWAMVCPGDPERAADMAQRAASVSHDGVAVHGAQVIAAMEAAAFVEHDIDKLIDTGLAVIPKDSLIRTLINDIRGWHADAPDDWRASLKKIQGRYGYDKYGGNCHMVPNHGLIIHSLLHGDGDFSRTLKIVNTAGWDTDCNSGNVGCLMGIRGGLAGIDSGPDWRGPVADQIYMPTAEPGRAFTDAVRETLHIVNSGRSLHGEPPLQPKGGAPFHFDFPGSVQGFRAEGDGAVLNNTAGYSTSGGRSLALHINVGEGIFSTPVFVESKEVAAYFDRGYRLMGSPILHAGQQLHARVSAGTEAADCRLVVHVFDADDQLQVVAGPQVNIAAGSSKDLTWTVPDTHGFPIAKVGVAVRAAKPATVYLDYLKWEGSPTVELKRVAGSMWHRAWVNAVDSYAPFYPEAFRLIQNQGTGLLLHGSREWRDYRVSADVTPHLAARSGIVARVQGLRRYYALTLDAPNQVTLSRCLHQTANLISAPLRWQLGTTYGLALVVSGDRLQGYVDGQQVLEAHDDAFANGGIGLLIDEGRTATQRVTVTPA